MGLKAQKIAPGKQRPGEDDREESLQAVVLADTFETRFAPLTLERPRCMLPLANVPLIEYTFEYLTNAGVYNVFIYGGSHTEQLESYISTSKWKTPTSPFKSFTFLKSQALSVGDVMRDLDSKRVITGDFLLISGDVVSNFPIEDAIAQHRSRRKKDKNAIMTILLREANINANKRLRRIPLFVVDPAKNRCLHYQEIDPQCGDQLSIDSDILPTHSEIDIRLDLLDTRIDVCSADVLSLWSDNFDNQYPRKDFLHGVLKDHELNGKTIHTYIIKNHYAARVADLQAYDWISRDLRSRWAYPLNPDTNFMPPNHYSLSHGGVYQEKGVTLARSSEIGSGSIIGQTTSIGDGSKISNSIIGRRCIIGKNVHIKEAHVWDDVVIGSGSKIEKCIVANEAVIGDNCSAGPGALISFRVRLASGTTVMPGARFTTTPSTVPTDEGKVGPGGYGYLYEEDEELADAMDSKASGLGRFKLLSRRALLTANIVYQMAGRAESSSSLSSDISLLSDEKSKRQGSRSESFATSLSDDDTNDRFHQEAVTTIFERIQRNTEPDDVRIELMSLRFGSNASEQQARKAVAVALMKQIQNLLESKTSSVEKAVRETLSRYKLLIQRDKDNEVEENQVEFMLLVQTDLAHRKDGKQILLLLSQQLYEEDLFGEEVFETWWNDARSTAEEDIRAVRESTKPFIDWLATAEEESGNEDENESNSESE